MALFHEGYDDTNAVLSSARQCQRAALNFETYLRLEEDLTLRSSSNDRFKQELEHIHNKMLFDAFNEAMDHQRPFNLKGKLPPLSIQILTFQDVHSLGEQMLVD